MKSASEWADELAGHTFGLDIEPQIKAIQTDAIKAAADKCLAIIKQERPNSNMSDAGLAACIRFEILSLLPPEA